MFQPEKAAGYEVKTQRAGKWIRADQLQAGNRLLSTENRWVTITGVEMVAKDLHAYNLDVSENDNFYVRAGGAVEHDGVWFHNCDVPNDADDLVRVRHHTSPDGAKGIASDGSINPGRGDPVSVHVETAPFGPSKTASAETGAFGRGNFVEFDVPRNSIQRWLTGSD